MSRNHRVVHAPPDVVWAVLSDGWLYAIWVVGAARMRAVDERWPAQGSQLHHSAGVWPLLVDDRTEVRASEPERLLRLRARGWPAGEAAVGITLAPHAQGTLVTIEEDAVRGPGSLVPKPLRTMLLSWRNTESLRRLALIAEGR